MIIAVDLDGTLVKTDMLFETLLGCISNDFKIIFKVLIVLLFKGRVGLKNYLCDIENIDYSTLPYNKLVLNKIKIYKQKGYKIFLVTASPTIVGEKINKHLNVFDEVFGSTENVNLKGKTKRDFLNKKFGKNTYIYIGNSYDDVAVWKDSHSAILVNTNKYVKYQVKKFNITHEKLESNNNIVLDFLSAIRIKQWIKNILVFLPLIAAQNTMSDKLITAIFAALAFSLIASGVYIFNDLLDIKSDRNHMYKKKRVLASGQIQLEHSFLIAIMLWISALSLSIFINFYFTVILIAYLILNFLYSFKLKKIPILDIYILASFYSLRIFSGSIAYDIDLSVWLMAFSIFVFYSLACLKRSGEALYNKTSGNNTISIRGYSSKDTSLLFNMSVTSGYASVILLALYINTPEVTENYNFPIALWVILFVFFYWINYIIFRTYRGDMFDDPVIFAIKDKISIFCGLLILAFWSLATIYEY